MGLYLGSLYPIAPGAWNFMVQSFCLVLREPTYPCTPPYLPFPDKVSLENSTNLRKPSTQLQIGVGMNPAPQDFPVLPGSN